jgi:hypothetical protein
LHLLRFGQFLQFLIVQYLQFFNFTLQLLNATAEALNLTLQSLYLTLAWAVALVEVLVLWT